MRLDDIIMHSTQKVSKLFTDIIVMIVLKFSQIEIMEFTSEDKEKREPVLKPFFTF